MPVFGPTLTRRAVLTAALGTAASLGAGVGTPARAAARTLKVTSTASGLPFMLGASGDGVPDGQYAAALGRNLDIVATWMDTTAAMTALWELQPGGDLASWRGGLDVAVAAFDRGGSWKAAAAGSYDALWSTSLRNLRAARISATTSKGPTFIRFAHEMNGDWYPWGVTVGQETAFATAWRRFRALQLSLFPEAWLVFCANQNTSGYAGDWRTLYPGSGQADVIGVDYYNQYPYLATAQAFTEWLPALDRFGGPAGLSAHAAFAKSVGLPLALPEWSAVASNSGAGGGGDAPSFVTGMHDFFTSRAGAGAGQVLYACQFNVSQGHDAGFNLLINTRMPASSATYQQLFGRS